MKIVNDDKFITADEVQEIILANFDSCGENNGEKGAGSFCKFVKYNGRDYALLTKRAENLVFNSLKNIMSIINDRELPVAIVGAGGDIKVDGDYMIILPQIKGINLPSYVYGLSKNITLASATSAISQEAMTALAAESKYLNENCVSIDFHGGNFVWQQEKDAVRMLDLKKRASMKEGQLFKRFIKLTAVNQLRQFKNNNELIAKIKGEQGVDIDMITMKNVVKSYTALLQSGTCEDQVATALKGVLGPQADIDHIAGLIR